MTNAMKNKDFAFKVKIAVDDPAGTIEGYVSVYGVRDSYNEVVMPGAFADSLARHKREGSYPLMLWQHDTYEPIGVWGDLSDDGKGLYAKGKLLIEQNVPCADKVYSLLKADAVRGMSIGYREIDVEPGTNGDPTKLIKLDIMEASVVSFPANRRAAVDAVKSDDENRAIQFWKRFEDWARRVGDGELPAPNEFEDVLRDARVSKSQRARIASRMHAVLRSESGEDEASNAISRLDAALKAFSPA